MVLVGFVRMADIYEFMNSSPCAVHQNVPPPRVVPAQAMPERKPHAVRPRLSCPAIATMPWNSSGLRERITHTGQSRGSAIRWLIPPPGEDRRD